MKFLRSIRNWFIDHGFIASVLLSYSELVELVEIGIGPGMKAGQVKFFQHKPVPYERSYVARGQYHGPTKAAASKGLR